MNVKILITIVLFSFVIKGCNNPENYKSDIKENDMLNISDFDSLRGKRIYFGHQSVGSNMIDGLNSLIKKNADLNFIKIIPLDKYLSLQISGDDSSFYFIHSSIGKNKDPESKLEDFKNKIGTLKKADAAFLKFCFVDIDQSTDINLLYNNYINTISSLQENYVNIKFIYCTDPLTSESNYLIRLIKTLTGRSEDNIYRNKFNNLLRRTGNINVFDIAYLESNLDDTKPKAKEYLLDEYTYDGGHLNEIGSEKVAYNLLVFLNNLF